MRKLLAVIAASCAVCLNSIGPAEANTLAVETFNHPPNYALSTDPYDIRQLTDGVLAPFPIWTSKQTVGWAALTPIAIRLRVPKGEANHPMQAGTIRVHSAKGLGARVDIPRHIDVYTQGPGGQFQLVGSADPNSEALADKSSHWLAISVSAATDTLVVVLHAAGDYVFLDELEWSPIGAGNIPTAVALPDVNAVIADSTRRTRDALTRAIEAEIRGATIPWRRTPCMPGLKILGEQSILKAHADGSTRRCLPCTSRDMRVSTRASVWEWWQGRTGAVQDCAQP